ncbi:MAG: hypothetical protein AAF799_24925 [Myxococcota bacterium]
MSRRFASRPAAILALGLAAGCGGGPSDGSSARTEPSAGQSGAAAGPKAGAEAGAKQRNSEPPARPQSESGAAASPAADADPPAAGDSPDVVAQKIPHDEPAAKPEPPAPAMDGAVAPPPVVPTSAPGTPLSVSLATVDVDLPPGVRCKLQAIALPGLPAVRADGTGVALSTFVGPANADDWALDHDLVVLDRAGVEQAKLRLWTGSELESVDSKKTCQAFRRTIDARVAEARKHLAGRWRPLVALPVHVDRVRDLEAPREACGGWSFPKPNPVPGDPPVFASCGAKPPTLEVAVVAGSSLVVRVPKVKVYHRQPEPGLARMKIVDAWDPAMCSKQAVIEQAWRDEPSGVVLVRLDGSDFTMDGCGYEQQFRVMAPDLSGFPNLPWSRQPSSVDLVTADRVFASP